MVGLLLKISNIMLITRSNNNLFVWRKGKMKVKILNGDSCGIILRRGKITALMSLLIMFVCLEDLENGTDEFMD
jgi:hypothetical protein